MSTPIEIELKSMLTQDEFERLKRHFQCEQQHPITQENRYFDTEQQALKHLNAALRLRVFDPTSEWTLKQAIDAHTAYEWTQPNSDIPNSPQAIHHAELLDFLDAHAIALETLLPTYTLQTQRWEILTPEGIYCLDCSTYSGYTDYEIELETTDLSLAQTHFHQLLNTLHIPYRFADKKIARAAKYLAKL